MPKNQIFLSFKIYILGLIWCYKINNKKFEFKIINLN